MMRKSKKSLKKREKRKRKWKMRRNKKKRPRVKLVHPQGQALEAVGVDALGGHVDVGVVVHPKPFFSPRETMFCLFFSQLKKKKCASPISNTIHGFKNIY